jgi:methylmalonyl-CoA mutase N-terminal domain/subunit
LFCQNTKLGAIFTLVSAGKCSGEFPFTAGLYPLSVKENPSRMFAEGGPERTNKRFHYVSAGLPAKGFLRRDGVTLYGNDPHVRPDIYGKLVMPEFLFVV